MKLQLKVREGVSEGELREILSKADGSRASHVHQLSPNHPVEEMRSLYSVEVPDSVDGSFLLKRLKRERAFEFVELQVTRKLIKPIRPS